MLVISGNLDSIVVTHDDNVVLPLYKKIRTLFLDIHEQYQIWNHTTRSKSVVKY